mgnify:CR=1 FL=1
MFGDVNVVRAIVKKNVDEVTEEEITTFLELATRRIQSKYTTDNWDRFVVTSQDNTELHTFILYFEAKRLDATKYIRQVTLDDTVLASTSYTLATDNLTLTIASATSLSGVGSVYIYYTPKIYDDLANYMAAVNIFLTKTVNVGENSVIPAIIRNLKDEIADIDKAILHKPSIVPLVMHAEKTGVW